MLARLGEHRPPPDRQARPVKAWPEPPALTPEQSEGPYYLDLDLVRADIREERPGVPLRLVVVVADTTGKRLGGVGVEVWHCDALGVYSWDGRPGSVDGRGRGGAGAGHVPPRPTAHRRAGRCGFETIYPGWYAGRSVHIHAKIHHPSGTLTTQLYFPELMTDLVHQQEPYRSRPPRDTLNAEDGIYDGVGDATVLEPAREGDAYSAAISLVVPAGR